MPLPDYIDTDLHKLKAILKQLIQNERQFDLDIATDEAWIRLEEPLDKLKLAIRRNQP